MTWATWVIALASLVTAATDVAVTIGHARRDNARFTAHSRRITRHDVRLTRQDQRLDKLENDGESM